MTIITENAQIDTPAVVSMFDARKRRYEQALDTYNSHDCRSYDIDGLIEEELLINVAVENRAALLATSTSTLADVLFKVELSRDELDEFTCEDGAVALLNSAIAALQAGNTAEAIRAIEDAIGAIAPNHADGFIDGAIGALADLHRMDGRQ